ncbi:hypothetical protein BDV95DRAFT_327745 [Massariosphaeria phaeospora]|uniref:F-box domain-containing protein n=1 Tax=Massariosphaeria phaeospora TaxID=100035 RepID=A0A7C8MPT0_9PLEO|nr:hypothetical protein BDV95DRAFT_327745 [Massariosphaeria phaeospora]
MMNPGCNIPAEMSNVQPTNTYTEQPPPTLPSATHARLLALANRLFTDRFSTLPAEIRLQIYGLVFSSNTSRTRHKLALLRVSKLVYSETFSIALSYTQLCFSDIKTLLDLWRELPVEIRKKVKRVKIAARAPKELYEIPAVLQVMCENMHLEVLTMVLKVRPRPSWKTSRTTPRLRDSLVAVDKIDHIAIRAPTEDKERQLDRMFYLVQFISGGDAHRAAERLSETDPETWVHHYGAWPDEREKKTQVRVHMVRSAILVSIL